jgi:hypothetical protein
MILVNKVDSFIIRIVECEAWNSYVSDYTLLQQNQKLEYIFRLEVGKDLEQPIKKEFYLTILIDAKRKQNIQE